MSRHLLISGIPATGKSTFGRWLRDERGFVYVNVEARPQDPESLEGTGFRQAWDSLFTGDPEPIKQELAGRPGVVFDWGFPVGSIFAVARIAGVGLEPWWFDGDRLVARDHFARRGTVAPQSFDAQCASICSVWPAIAAFYGNRIVKVARTDGTLMPPAEVAKLILGHG